MTVRGVRRSLPVWLLAAALLSACGDSEDTGVRETPPTPTSPSTAPTVSESASQSLITPDPSLLTPDPAMAVRVSELFIRFALDGSWTPPVDTPVGLYLGNAFVKTILAEESSDPLAYELCETYAARSCPMSAVSVVRGLGVDGTRVGEVSGRCLVRSGPAPTDTGGPHLVTIRPANDVPCNEDFAVQLSVNDVGQMTAVNLLLGTGK